QVVTGQTAIDQDVLRSPLANDRVDIFARTRAWNCPCANEFGDKIVLGVVFLDQIPDVTGRVIVSEETIRGPIEQEQPAVDRKPTHRWRWLSRCFDCVADRLTERRQWHVTTQG